MALALWGADAGVAVRRVRAWSHPLQTMRHDSRDPLPLAQASLRGEGRRLAAGVHQAPIGNGRPSHRTQPNMGTNVTRNAQAAAERMRRLRQRRRDGLVYLGIELRVTEIERLVALGYLNPNDRDEPQKLLDAFYWFLDRQLG